MRNKLRILHSGINQYYGLCILAFVEALCVVFLILYHDDIYIAVNDNLDSNVALVKVFKDNNMWMERSEPVPILGGVDRSILSCGYTINYLLYCFFDTEVAYWLNYLIAIIISGIGFYLLGGALNKFIPGSKNNANMFCIMGIIYAFLGIWPHAIIGASLIPIWIYLVLEICITKEIWLCVFFYILQYNIPTILFGCFILLYTFLFCIVVIVKKADKRKQCVSIALSNIIIFLWLNGDLLGKVSEFICKGKTIKSLAYSNGVVYSDDVYTCIEKFIRMLFFDYQPLCYSGSYSLKYVAVPIIYLFFIFINLLNFKQKINHSFLVIFNFVIGAILLNSLFAAFDSNTVFRDIIPFLSGFSFARFVWLNTFLVMLGLSMIASYFSYNRLFLIDLLMVTSILFSIIIDKDATEMSSIYSNLHVFYSKNILSEEGGGEYAKWGEYYATELFESIKESINYNGEWCVSYGFEPGVLQYNGIRTLDGYYSNYSTSYNKEWQRLIAPVLKKNDNVKKYWLESNGQRAYVYSEDWNMPDYSLKFDKNKEYKMLIDRDVLAGLGGKYVFSRCKISNSKELEFDYLGTWNDNRNHYEISVYYIN